MTKHIFITGGVVSSLGKGITGAALAMLLAKRGYRIAMQKLDPYLNVDPGTMSPYQHGEVFVTDDGAETDLDLGHYERIAGVRCSKASNFTSGKIYSNVIARERSGGYLGGTVQVIPHITDEIRRAMQSLHRRQDRPVLRSPDHRNRRHGGRYREPAVPRSGAAVQTRGPPGRRDLPASDARAVHPGRERA